MTTLVRLQSPPPLLSQLPQRTTGTRAAPSRPSSTATPPVGPSSSSTACSGCGIRPSTLPASFVTPAIAADGAVHVARRSGTRSGRAPRARRRSSSSPYQLPSPCLIGITSSCPTSHVAGERARRALDRDRHVGADELLLPVQPQHAGQQARLAEDLEAVADAEHRAARGGEGARRPPSPARTGRSRRSAGSRRTRSRPAGRPRRCPSGSAVVGVPDANRLGAERARARAPRRRRRSSPGT